MRLPTVAENPVKELVRRALLALAIIALNSFIVWLDRDSYSDNVNGDGVSLIDAIYYATVTVTTTGYGDITPVSQHARLLMRCRDAPAHRVPDPAGRHHARGAGQRGSSRDGGCPLEEENA